MKKNNDLTNRQNEILTFIKKYIAKNNYAPSIREIGVGVKLSSPATVHAHVKNLTEKGYLKRGANNHKILELMVPNEFEHGKEEAVQVPFLEDGCCENLLEEIDEPNEYFFLPTQMIPTGSEVFVFKIEVDIPNLGIQKDDIIIVEKTSNIQEKDIVIATLDQHHLILKSKEQNYRASEISSMSDLIESSLQKNIIILGKIVGLYRQF